MGKCPWVRINKRIFKNPLLFEGSDAFRLQRCYTHSDGLCGADMVERVWEEIV